MAIHSDSFAILRDCRALFLKHLGALLQDSQLVSGHAISAIQQGAGAYFDEIVSTERRGNFAEEASGLTASRITLLAEDDLELGIRLDNLTARLLDNAGSSLWKLHLRFVTLLRRPDLSNSDNPVGPKSICRGLNAMFAAAGASNLDTKLALLDRFETYLRQNLPGLYAELNDFLDRAGIETAQPAIVTSPDSPATAREQPASLSNNALLALQQALLANLPAQSAGVAAQPAGGSAAANLLSQSALEQLMFRLEALERMGRFGPPVIPGSTPAGEPMMPALFSESATPSAPKIIRSAELGIPKTSTESLAIDTLALIFEAILADPELPDAVKAVISSLQIKLLKVAMKDSTLFTNPTHPARQVIDRMAQAALGLPSDVSPRHTVCKELFEVASRLRAEPGNDHAVFDSALGELDTQIAQRQAQLIAAASPYLPLVDDLDRHDRVAGRARATIEQGLDTQPPEVARRFLIRTWHQVLLQTGHQHGLDSPPWQACTAAIDGLLWSFLPKVAADDRKLLAHRLPAILKTIKEGMQRVGMPPAEQEDFLDECFKLQTLALRATPMPTANPGEAMPGSQLPAPSGKLQAGELRAGDLILRTLDFADYQPPPSQPLACRLGDWLGIRLADETTGIGQVCHISQDSQRTLLLNPERGLAIALHPAILDRQLRSGDATIRSGQSLFENAASRAIGQTGRN
jgi:hypothetical protein